MPLHKQTLDPYKPAELNENGVSGLSRKEKEYLTRRQSILDAALKLFSAKGYSGASMQEIAQLSEFSIGTLYNFFETKESLYLTLVEDKFNKWEEIVNGVLAKEKDCESKIRRAVETYLGFIEENREFFHIFLNIGSAPDAAVHGGVHVKVMEFYQEHVRIYVGLMDEGIKTGLFRDFTATELALSLIGNYNAAIYDWLIGSGVESLRARHERILDLFFSGALKQRSGLQEKRG